VQRGLSRGRVSKPLQIGDPRRGVRVAGAYQRVQNRQNSRGLRSVRITRGGGQLAESSRQGGPGPGWRGLGRPLPAGRSVLVRRQRGKDTAGVDGADAVMQAQQPEPGEIVGGIGQDPGGGEEVFDVSGVGEPQPGAAAARCWPGGC